MDSVQWIQKTFLTTFTLSVSTFASTGVMDQSARAIFRASWLWREYPRKSSLSHKLMQVYSFCKPSPLMLLLVPLLWPLIENFLSSLALAVYIVSVVIILLYCFFLFVLVLLILASAKFPKTWSWGCESFLPEGPFWIALCYIHSYHYFVISCALLNPRAI